MICEKEFHTHDELVLYCSDAYVSLLDDEPWRSWVDHVH
jgi:hypothetical protein